MMFIMAILILLGVLFFIPVIAIIFMRWCEFLVERFVQ